MPSVKMASSIAPRYTSEYYVWVSSNREIERCWGLWCRAITRDGQVVAYKLYEAALKKEEKAAIALQLSLALS